MIKIYSAIKTEKLLHVILKKEDVTKERTNVVEAQEFLQFAAMKLPKGDIALPHKHVACDKTATITQESWVIIQGKIKVILYDINDEILAEEVLLPGDCNITLYGAHAYEILEEDTIIYEYKTGPYQGIEKDREHV